MLKLMDQEKADRAMKDANKKTLKSTLKDMKCKAAKAKHEAELNRARVDKLKQDLLDAQEAGAKAAAIS